MMQSDASIQRQTIASGLARPGCNSVSSDTPGKVLVSRFLKPMNLSARQVARDLNVSVNRITLIINGQRKLTAETAVLFEQRFGLSAEI